MPNGIRYGLLSIEGVDSSEIGHFLSEARRLISLLPSYGLVVDIRGNPGGAFLYARYVWEMIFSGEPASCQSLIRATPFIADVFSVDDKNVEQIIRSNVATHQPFTGPCTPPAGGDRVFDKAFAGRHVIVLVDAMSGSAADYFASLVKDSETSEQVMLYGTDAVTQGVGTTRVDISSRVNASIVGSHPEFYNLPKKVDVSIVFRRFYRSGGMSGSLIEQLEVGVDRQYFETRTDIVTKGEDMLIYFGRALQRMQRKEGKAASLRTRKSARSSSTRRKDG